MKDISFYNDPEKKAEMLALAKHHQKFDAFIQSIWQSKEKIEGNIHAGCQHGCLSQGQRLSLEEEDNPRLATNRLWVNSLWWCYITECIFEGLPKDQAKLFPVQSIGALPIGIDMNIYISEWNKIILTDQLRFVKKGSEQETAIKTCINLFDVPFDKIDKAAARVAEWAARAAARVAEWAAEGAEWEDYYIFMRNEFLSLFK